MRLKKIRIQNFRAIRDAEIYVGPHTAILGGNGAGKSTILRAIEKFYSPSANVEADDFYERDLSSAIQITLTFSDFNSDERECFKERIHSAEMSVTRVFESSGGRNNGKYYGTSKQYPRFVEIRAIEGARERRTAFNYAAEELGLPAASNAQEVENSMSAWESANPDQCEQRVDDGAFFGFSNVARGNLQRSTSFVFVPAVRDVSSDSIDARGAAIAKLLELVVRNAVQRRSDITDFQKRISEDYRSLVDPSNLTELNSLAGDLSATLQDYYSDTAVRLLWQPHEEFTIPLPRADVKLRESDFEGPVDRKGHGLQRAFILTLLQHLARVGSIETPPRTEVDLESAGPASEPALPVLPGLILAIEEPELYQHPTKQRHFAKVLQRLSDGQIPGVAAQTQVLFASHSPLFVNLERFDELRLARRLSVLPIEKNECSIFSSSLEQVAKVLEIAHNAPSGTFSGARLRRTLHIFGPELAEGFFADLVVLVEGVSDRAAIIAAAQMDGYDLEAAGIAVLWVDGKSKLDRPAAIFQSLNIPVYLIFDCDGSSADNEKINRSLNTIMGGAEPFVAGTRFTDRYACFEQKLEKTIESDLTTGIYTDVLGETQQELGLKKAEILKVPTAMVDLLTRAKQKGHQSHSLQEIISRVRKLRLG